MCIYSIVWKFFTHFTIFEMNSVLLRLQFDTSRFCISSWCIGNCWLWISADKCLFLFFNLFWSITKQRFLLKLHAKLCRLHSVGMFVKQWMGYKLMSTILWSLYRWQNQSLFLPILNKFGFLLKSVFLEKN